MQSDVVIIGGGAIGAAAAYFLRIHPRAGSVTVIERDPTYQWASTPRASGGVRRLFALPENIELSNYSIPFFERFETDMAVERRAGRDQLQERRISVHRATGRSR